MVIFLDSPWVDFYNLVIGETDESVWLCSVPGGPLRCVKLDGLKLLRGICTMQYFQSFIIVLFLFFPSLNYFCSLLGYQY